MGLLSNNPLDETIINVFHGTLPIGVWPLFWYLIATFSCACLTYGASSKTICH